jgi:hypothetical protein
MPITILDYVKTVVGDKDFYTAEDCLISGVDIIGGCQRCADCIGDTGFATVTDFTTHTSSVVTCPACGNTDTISETRITTSDQAEEYALECGDCGEVWQR